MDWLKWPMGGRRQSAEAKRRRDSQPVLESTGHPLVFRSSADACRHRPHGSAVASQVMLGLCDAADDSVPGSEFAREVLTACQAAAVRRLLKTDGEPGAPALAEDRYEGPVCLLKEAFQATRSAGSANVALATLDNTSMIHGQVHPMVAMLTVGDCELLQLRRCERTSDVSGEGTSTSSLATFAGSKQPPSPEKTEFDDSSIKVDENGYLVDEPCADRWRGKGGALQQKMESSAKCGE